MAKDELAKVRNLADELEREGTAKANNVVPLLAALQPARDEVGAARHGSVVVAVSP